MRVRKLMQNIEGTSPAANKAGSTKDGHGGHHHRRCSEHNALTVCNTCSEKERSKTCAGMLWCPGFRPHLARCSPTSRPPSPSCLSNHSPPTTFHTTAHTRTQRPVSGKKAKKLANAGLSKHSWGRSLSQAHAAASQADTRSVLAALLSPSRSLYRPAHLHHTRVVTAPNFGPAVPVAVSTHLLPRAALPAACRCRREQQR